MDDPLSLLSLGIWLMAAGMYPLGFLFGACSACCDECPEECRKCTHFFNDTACENYMDVSVTVTSDLLGGDTVSQSGVCGIDGEGFDITLANSEDPSLPQCILDVVAGIGVVNKATVNIARSIAGDECGCEVFEITGGVEIAVEYEGSVLRFGATFTAIDGDSCDGGVLPIEFAPIAFQQNDGWPVDDPECDAELAQWLNDNLAFSGTITLGTCDCGACCDDGCEEDVAEGGCESWQGVGTDCDPDPCV